MGSYALVNRQTNTVLRRKELPALDRDDGKNVVWLPVVSIDIPAYDPSIQTIQRITTITPSSVIDDWTISSIPAEAPEVFMTRMTVAMQRVLDSWAQEKGYDGILSLCSYAPSEIPQFASEAATGIAARDAMWAAGYAVINEITAGTRSVPTDEELFASLPIPSWE